MKDTYFSGKKIPSLKKRQDSVSLENGADTESAKVVDADPSTDTKTAKDTNADPPTDSGTSEDGGDSSDYDYEDEDSTELAENKTCLGGLPREYCAAVVEILLFIGLFIGGFIRLR